MSIPSSDLPNSSYEQDAANLAFDLTRQFITIAIGGIGFAVGIHLNSPSSVSNWMLWAILLVFGGSTAFGLVFIMHGVSRLSKKKSYDVYAIGLRVTSISQILLVMLGVVLLCSFLEVRSDTLCDEVKSDAPCSNIQVKIGDDSLVYPHETNKSYTIEIESGKVRFSATCL